MPVPIETHRGPLASAQRKPGAPTMRSTQWQWRDKGNATRTQKTSDNADAKALASILRKDAHAHRMLPAGSDLARFVTMLALAAQDAFGRRSMATQELRTLLREDHPGFLDAFTGAVHTNLAMEPARCSRSARPAARARH